MTTMTTMTTAAQLKNGSWDVVARRTTASFTVRNWGLVQVHGTIAVQTGQVTIADGEPVAASATLEAASVSTGIKKRDIDLTGRHFLSTTEHPELRVTVGEIRQDGDGWAATATLHVAGGRAPLELAVRRTPDPEEDGTVRVVATGILDRRATPIRAPRILIGRWITVEVDATLRPGD